MTRHGFALLELLIAITIMLILGAVVMPVQPKLTEYKLKVADKTLLDNLAATAYIDRCKDTNRIPSAADGNATTNLTDLPRPGESAGSVRIESSSCPNDYCVDDTLKNYLSYISGTIYDDNFGITDSRRHPVVFISESKDYEVYVSGDSLFEVSAVFLLPGIDGEFQSTVSVSRTGSTYTITVTPAGDDFYTFASVKGDSTDWTRTRKKISLANSAYSIAQATGCPNLADNCGSDDDDTQHCISGILSNCPDVLDRSSDSYDEWGNLLYWDYNATSFYSAGPDGTAGTSDDVSVGNAHFNSCDYVM